MKTLILNKFQIISKFTTAVLLLLFMNSLSAGEINNIKTLLNVNSISVPNKQLSINDPDAGIFSNEQYQYKIKLIYGRNNRTDMALQNVNENWSFEVTYNIILGTNLTIYNQKVKIDWNHNNPSTLVDLNLYDLYPNASSAVVTITSVNPVLGSAATLPNDIQFELIQRKNFSKNLYNVGLQNSQIGSLPVNNGEKLSIYWQYVNGAEEYELEWVFIDHTDKNFTQVNVNNVFNHADLNTTFTDNRHYKEPVNIVTADNWYDIPLTHTKGILFYRIRPIGKHALTSENTSFGLWNAPAIVYNHSAAFENSKNWQTVVTYAEDGKSKNIISYLDGSGRQRQSLTDLSTSNKTLVVETMYDYEGRSSLNILPVPLNSGSLTYVSHMNVLENTSNLFTKEHFDKPTPTPGLDINSGASKYYSELNNMNQINQDFIPNAEKYPFTQTQFLRDGTGRPRAQSGIGKDMQLLSGKETKYYYGSPTETELRRLFGSNVGLAKFCRKNMFKDPNGQLSVSYLDYQGRTIATALIGESPENVIKLANSTPEIISNLGGDNNVLDLEARTWTSVSKILNSVEETDYNFYYDFAGAINQLGAPFNICSTCEYDLEIMIKDPNGKLLPIFSSSVCAQQGLANPTPSFHTNFNQNLYKLTASYPESTINCTTDAYPSSNINFTMKFCEIGDYEVIKILHINDNSLEAAFDVLVGSIDTHQLHQDIITNELSQINYNQCNYTCAQTYWEPCKAIYMLNNGMSETSWNNLTENQKNDALTSCVKDSCNAALSWVSEEVKQSECASYLRQMKDQMKRDGVPNGINDGVYNNEVNSSQEGLFWLLVIGKLNGLSGIDQEDFIEQASICYPDLEFVDDDSDGEIDNYTARVTTIVGRMRTDTGYCEFIEDWTVRAHPEYCHYEICVSNIESETYNLKLQLIGSFDEAISINNNYNNYKFAVPLYFNSNTSSNLNSSITMPSGYPNYFSTNAPVNFPGNATSYTTGMDPYFSSTGLGFTYLADIKQEMENFSGSVYDVAGNNSGYDMWHYFHPQATHPSNNGTTTGADRFYSSVDMTDRDEVLEKHWQLFTSAYKELKKQVQAEYKKDNCDFLDKSYAVVKNETLPSTQAEADAFINIYASGYITDVCEAQLAAWRAQLIENCPGLTVSYYNSNIAPYLLEYCTSNAGFANPDGLIFTADLSNAGAGDPLYEAAQALAACPACSTCYLDSIVTDNPYTLLIDSNSNNYQYNLANIDGCLQEVLDHGNDIEFMNGNQQQYYNTHLYLASTIYCDSSYNFFTFQTHGNLIRFYCAAYETNENYLIFVNEEGDMLDIPFTSITNINISNNAPSLTTSVYEWVSTQYNVSKTTAATLVSSLNTTAEVITSTGDTYQVWIFQVLHPNNVSGNYCSFNVTTLDTTNVIGGIDSSYLNTGKFEIDFDSLTLNCQQQLEYEAIQNADRVFQDSLTNLVNQHLEQIIDNCTNFDEQFYVSYLLKEYHYTLYYYDQAGNLTQTVPPEGVHPVSSTHFPLSNNGNWDGTEPVHTLPTLYTYNTLNQVIEQTTPDGGTSHFFYDKKGQLKLSVNAQQLVDSKASYTLYDNLGRVKEVGELDRNIIPNTFNNIDVEQWRSGMSKLVFKEYATDQEFIETFANSTNDVHERTLTAYGDQTTIPYLQAWQENLRGRVTAVYNTDAADNLVSKTLYSYDEHGNVKKLANDIENFDAKELQYEYDLVSGNVNKVIYQAGKADQFMHKYEYDADNRLTNVYTSTDGTLWDEDAEYFYYAHGPLARVEIGEDKIQGLDYYYTLHGWLKGINTPENDYKLDPGNDGLLKTDNLNINNARDEFALALGYYNGDYKSISNVNIGAGTNAFSSFNQNLWYDNNNDGINDLNSSGLFNGNIAYMISNIAPQLNATSNAFEKGSLIGMAYQYDQLNRIKKARSYHDYNGTNFATRTTDLTANISFFDVDYAYDANGNLKNLTRAAYNVGIFDNFTYNYNNPNNILQNNKLRSVSDAVSTSSISQDIKHGQSIDNYNYDNIGNLKSDESEEIDDIKWTVYGKVSEIIRKNTSTKSDLLYLYDAMGNRIAKIEKTKASAGVLNPEGQWVHTYYTRDASGNIMANYTATGNTLNNEVEYPIYGSSRLGVNKLHINWNLNAPPEELYLNNVNIKIGHLYTDIPPVQYINTGDIVTYNGFQYTITAVLDIVYSPFSSAVIGAEVNLEWQELSMLSNSRTVGNKFYELSNHLGNVNVVVSDRRRGIDALTYTGSDYGSDLNGELDPFSSTGSTLPQKSVSGDDLIVTTYGNNDGLVGFIPATAVSDILAYNVDFVASFTADAGTCAQFIIEAYDATNNQSVMSDTLNGSGNLQVQMPFTSYVPPSGAGTPYDLEFRYYGAQPGTFTITSSINWMTMPDGVAEYYLADVVNATDYYPYGSQQPGHIFNSQSYRYAFNGKELDREGMGGGGSTYDYGFRIYNPQIAKFLSVDPLFKSYPWYTPYQFAGNKPIIAIDLDGLEEFVIIYDYLQSKKEPKIKLSFDWEAEKLAEGNYYTVNNYYDDNGTLISKQTNTTSQFKIVPIEAETEKNWLQKAWDNVKNWSEKNEYQGGENSKFGGGFMLVSEKGEGTGRGREAGDNVDSREIAILDIDDLPLPNGGGGKINAGGKLGTVGDILEKLDNTLDGIDAAKTLNEAVVGEDNRSANDILDGDTVKCMYCTRQDGYVIQGNKNRIHYEPSNTDVPDEK